MRRLLTGVLLVAGLVLGTAATAWAGENTGQGNPVPRAGEPRSACHFSGRDLPDDVEGNPVPEANDDAVTDGHVQTYGMYVRAGLKDNPNVPSPGVACRGNASFEG